MTEETTPAALPVERGVRPDALPAVARLYYTGVGHRRYKRASVHNGPGEPLTFKSTAEQHLRWQAAAYEAQLSASHKLLRELTQVCTEFNDHTPQSWNRAVLAVGNAATVLLRPNVRAERDPTAETN